MKPKRELPLLILMEAYRPLAFFAAEALLAASPFLPARARAWARRLRTAADERPHAKSQSRQGKEYGFAADNADQADVRG